MSRSHKGRNALWILLIVLTVVSLATAVLSLMHAADSAALLAAADVRHAEQLRDLTSAQTSAVNAQARMDKANAEAEAALAEVTPLREANDALSTENATLTEQIAQLQTALDAEMACSAALTEEKAALTAQVQELTNRLNASETALSAAQESVRNLSERNTQLNATIDELNRTIAATQASLTAAEESIKALTGENADLHTRLDAALSSLMEAKNLLEAIKGIE